MFEVDKEEYENIIDKWAVELDDISQDTSYLDEDSAGRMQGLSNEMRSEVRDGMIPCKIVHVSRDARLLKCDLGEYYDNWKDDEGNWRVSSGIFSIMLEHH
jgi:hypothetical protein